MVEHFCTYRSKCSIYQEVNNDRVKRRFSLLWDLNIDIKLTLVKLVLTRRNIDKSYSKGFCDWEFPEKMKERFLCCWTKARGIWFRGNVNSKTLIVLLRAEGTPKKFVERNGRTKLTFETTASFKSRITWHEIVNFHNQCISPVIIKYSDCRLRFWSSSYFKYELSSLRGKGILIIYVRRHSSISSWNKASFVSWFRTSFGAKLPSCHLDLQTFKI